MKIISGARKENIVKINFAAVLLTSGDEKLDKWRIPRCDIFRNENRKSESYLLFNV